MLSIYHRNLKEKELKTLKKFKVGSWVYLEDPAEDELAFLTDTLKLDEGLVQDALDPYEVPRIETDEGITYIYTRVPYKEGGSISTIPILIALGKDFVLTLSKKHLPFLDQFRYEAQEIYTTQKVKFLIQLFFAINAEYRIFLTDISRQVRSARVRLNKIKNRDIIQLVNFEEVLNDFLSALIPTNSLLKNLLSAGHIRLFEEDKDLVEDLFLGTGQFIETCKSTLKNIVNIRDSYSTIMTHDLNRVIKLLTAITIILTVPTIIASLYGMNVPLPFQDTTHVFAGIVTVITLIMLGLVILFNRNDWL